MGTQCKLYTLFFCAVLLCHAATAAGINGVASATADFSIEQAVRSADIIRTFPVDTGVINLYQGNGRFGGCFGPLGLHLDPAVPSLHTFGPTHFMHMQHFARGKFGVDYLLPMLRIFWKEKPAPITEYRQQQSFFDGTISTRFGDPENSVTVTTWFDPIDRNMCGIKIAVQGQAPDIIIAPLQKLWLHYRQEAMQQATITGESGDWKIDLTCLNAASSMFLQTNARAYQCDERLCLKLKEGDNFIIFSVQSRPSASCSKSLSRTLAWWHSRWLTMGCLSLPNSEAQNLWVRTMAYVLYSHNDDKLGSAPPMGLTGIAWSFLFPQDLSFIYPLLLTTGNLSIVKTWVEYFAERLDGMRAYTKRIWGVEGVFCPWAVPYAGFDGFHEPSPPTKNYYSIHNSGYLARMAEEAGQWVNEDYWTEKYVRPVIRETALFYKSICRKESDGLWHLFVTPSTGQDENGGFNQKDYLCALYSAQYCFQKAVAYELDGDGTYRTILKDGLAFASLLNDKGFYFSNKGAMEENAGGQKHPVQLNELAFLPVHPEPSPSAAAAYRQRYEITINAKLPHFAGWTIGEFLIAGSRLGDAAGWEKDWGNLVRSQLADPDFIQLYESSGNNRSFYITTSSMVAQSLLNNVVDDWYGKLVIGQCIPWHGKIAFRNLYSRLGVSLSGVIDDRSATVRLQAWKDCRYEIQGKGMVMKKGETKTMQLEL